MDMYLSLGIKQPRSAFKTKAEKSIDFNKKKKSDITSYAWHAPSKPSAAADNLSFELRASRNVYKKCGIGQRTKEQAIKSLRSLFSFYPLAVLHVTIPKSKYNWRFKALSLPTLPNVWFQSTYMLF
jgi:hypothetical protein